ncbi:zinc finger BED domain-containing protein RICESLEEPER 2 [Tanacetum coccineum]
MDSKNDTILKPSSSEPTVDYLDDLDYFNDFENEFPAIVYNDGLISKPDLEIEPPVSSEHVSKFRTSLSEYAEEEQNILHFSNSFPLDKIFPNDPKTINDSDDDIDIAQPYRYSGNEKTVDQRHKRKPCGEKGPLPPKKQKTEDIFKSKWWKFYDPIYEVDEEGNKVRKSKCKFCEKILSAGGIHDENWKMHKRIINFRPINSHKGDDIGRKILECIADWGITNVMTITVDNASSNDKALNFLAKMLPKMYDEERHFQIRCAAHVLNLIVKDGLDECSDSVDSVRKAVRYIKLSTQQIEKFKDCIKDSRITTNCFLIGDCLTRWNSTHDMLKVACELKKPFELYDVGNSSFSNDLDKVPNATDFKICDDLWGVKEGYGSMVHEMRLKYDKYWGLVRIKRGYRIVSNDARIDFTCAFDILEWWRTHGPRFPVVALMARDILSIQISTVASESAFSTGRRVLDPYRTSLSSQLVEALLCTQDWNQKF